MFLDDTMLPKRGKTHTKDSKTQSLHCLFKLMREEYLLRARHFKPDTWTISYLRIDLARSRFHHMDDSKRYTWTICRQFGPLLKKLLRTVNFKPITKTNSYLCINLVRNCLLHTGNSKRDT